MSYDTRYTIVGNGRLAKHLCHYFSLKEIQFYNWCRKDDVSLLEKFLLDSDIVLLAISDGAIESFIDTKQELFKGKTIVHLSGALVTDKAYGCHPLMTFTHDLYDLEFYEKILFCIDEDCPNFKKLFPKLSNSHTVVPKKLKSFYHAIGVLACNFTIILWQKYFKEMEEIFGIKPEQIHNFLEQTTANIMKDHKNCLTGPLARGDKETIQKHLEALKCDPFKKVYESFVEAYNEINTETTTK